MASSDFNGFSKASTEFLKGLSANNSKIWFDTNRAAYDDNLLPEGKAFVAELGPRLQKIAPDVQFEPRVNGSIFRINRDIRFSKDKTPYKDHFDLWFWHGDRKGWGAPGFWFRLRDDRVLLGAGMHRLEKEPLKKFRDAVVADASGKALEKAMAKVLKAGPYEPGEATRKGVPRGYDREHPRARYLLSDGLFVHLEAKLPKEARKAEFVDWSAGHYKAMKPVVDWLLTYVSDGTN